jgi:MYXO-CTERM domain-containing protein
MEPPAEDPTNPEEPGPLAELPPQDRGCACSVPGRTSDTSPLALSALALLGLALVSRRKR